MKDRSELLTRAVEQVVPLPLAEEKLQSGKKLRLYHGIDPTGSKLHLGHSVPLRKLQAFADAGHEVVFLIGSFTAMIGDPTGQDKMREPLTQDQVQKNFERYKEQAEKILDFRKVSIRYNHEWLEKMSIPEIMKLASNFTVQQMMQRDMFRERMSWKVVCDHCGKLTNSPIQFQSKEEFDSAIFEGNYTDCAHCGKRTSCTKKNIVPPPNPISPNEFLYPLMQGYDSVVLDVDCEIGGNDQLFNMLCGRKLQKRYGKREKFVLTTKLIPGTDGRKMSKTYGNCIWLEDSAQDIYAKTMQVADDVIATYMECCTNIPLEEIAIIERKMMKEENPMTFKKLLAAEIVRMYHGDAAAKKAAEEFSKVFSDKELPSDIPEVQAKKGEFLLDVLLREKLIASKSEGRRLLEQKGIHLSGAAVMDVNAEAKPGTYKVGKRKFVKII